MDIKQNIFNYFPVIKFDEILLREISLNDVPNFFNYISHKEVSKFLSDDDLPTDIKHAQEELMYWYKLFRYKQSIYWAISIDNKMIGTCGFNNWNITHRRAEISYDLDYNYWNKGIMTKVVKNICNFAFKEMQVQRIQATVAEDNIGSTKLLEKNEFMLEGKLRKFGVLHGEEKNFLMYSLIK